jgi:hypothetical protein
VAYEGLLSLASAPLSDSDEGREDPSMDALRISLVATDFVDKARHRQSRGRDCGSGRCASSLVSVEGLASISAAAFVYRVSSASVSSRRS